MENGMQMTLEECMPETFQKPTAGVSDSLARTYPLQESKPDFKETVQACFSELCTLSDSSKKKINPLTFSLRTLKICLVLMEDGISPDCSLKWSREGMMQNGRCSTPKISECHKTGKDVLLSDILEEEVPQKYFLSKEQTKKNSVSLNLFGCLNGRNSQRDRVYSGDGLAPTISTKPGENTEPKVSIKIIGEINSSQDGKILSTDGIAKCHSAGHDNNPKIAIPVLTPDRAEKRQNGRRFKEDGEPMFTLTSQDRHGVAVEPIGILRNVRTEYGKEIRKDYESGKLDISRHDFLANEIREDGIANTLSTVQKDNRLAVKVAEATKQGYSECRVGIDAVNLSVLGSKTRRGRVGKEIANTLDTSCNQGIFVKVSDELIVYAVWYEKYQCYIAIRKLTPKECFRLQGWSDDYFEKAQFVNSDSQLYRQAGNGVTVTVIEAMARKMNVNLN